MRRFALLTSVLVAALPMAGMAQTFPRVAHVLPDRPPSTQAGVQLRFVRAVSQTRS